MGPPITLSILIRCNQTFSDLPVDLGDNVTKSSPLDPVQLALDVILCKKVTLDHVCQYYINCNILYYIIVIEWKVLNCKGE